MSKKETGVKIKVEMKPAFSIVNVNGKPQLQLEPIDLKLTRSPSYDQ